MKNRALQCGAAAVVGLLLLGGSLFGTRLERAAIGAYRTYGSPVVGLFATCRFQPTCSAYALEVLEKEGFWMGNVRIASRLVQCSPLGWLWS